MKTIRGKRGLLFRALSLILIATSATAGSFFVHRPAVRLEGKLNCPTILEWGGTAYLQLSVITPESTTPGRRPMNLAVVLDRSGSMGTEQKMEYARAAVRSLVDQLRSDDVLSIVIYDDVVEVLRSACRVGNKEEVRRLIDEVAPRGWTNLGGGMIEGFRQVQKNSSRGFVNRVILVSDGLANRGITDPVELAGIARRYRNASVSLTAIGVGLDYNENLMVSLAESGGGNYYFVEHPRHLASMFRREFDGLQCLVAQNASIELKPGRGVEILDVVGCEHGRDGEQYAIALGDLYSSERRVLTIALRIPPGSGYRSVVRAVLRYSTEDNEALASNSLTVGVRYTPDLAEVDRHRDWDAQARSEVAMSTRKVEEALQALDRGDKAAALGTLKDVQKELAASPAVLQGGAAAEVIREQEAKLKVYTETLTRSGGDETRTKKSIQYENYKTQKKR
jgi:Ca-activated chloride channel family protein